MNNKDLTMEEWLDLQDFLDQREEERWEEEQDCYTTLACGEIERDFWNYYG